MSYQPTPIDTSGVIITKDIQEITELLAKNIHENWALAREKEGWRYGPQRNDERKENPCMVSYEELPDSEKAYDRIAALETIKTLIALGCRIEMPRQADPGVLPVPPCFPDSTLLSREPQAGQAIATANLPELLKHWNSCQADMSGVSLNFCQHLGSRILEVGEPMLAYDVVTKCRELWKGDIRLRQLQGLSLARCGATGKANKILRELYDEGNRDEETLGILARTHKDLWALNSGNDDSNAHLLLAAKLYGEAFKNTGGYWPGINAATMLMRQGNKEQAVALAGKVWDICRHELKKREGNDTELYWLLATMGEAALMMSEFQEAEECYIKAAVAGKNKFGSFNSTRRNIRLLTECIGIDSSRFERHLPIPRVAVFSGHMLDRSDRTSPRFPRQLEAAVTSAIGSLLERMNIEVAYASAACGADILFLEELLSRKGEVNIVLPYNQDLFIKTSVDIIPHSNYKQRFQSILEQAARVIKASSQGIELNSTIFDYTNILMHGTACIRAGQLDTELIPVAVWDGIEDKSITATMVKYWRNAGYGVEIIHTGNLLKENFPNLSLARATESQATNNSFVGSGAAREKEIQASYPMETVYILFADAVGFSKLPDEKIPAFVEHLLGAVADVLTRFPAPLMKNTWGDGLFLVFSNIKDAGNFALELRDLVNSINWQELGLPQDLNFRIALHAGPAYKFLDPVTQTNNYFGEHINSAARIETITPPSEVYSSEAFAALAAGEKVKDFWCEYVGLTQWAKKFGIFPTYCVRRFQ